MRYRIGTEAPTPGTPAMDHALYLEAGLGLLVGIVLVLASGVYIGALWLGVGVG